MSEQPAAPLALMVEDDDDLSLLLDFILRREGLLVERCADGRAAVARLGKAPVPDLVILDLRLPYVGGLELIAMIRARETWANVPLLMLTAQQDETDIANALDAGADDYLIKPFQPEELKARLRKLRKKSR